MENEVNEPQPVYKRSGYITPEEYFLMDEASEERLEYYDGKVYPVDYEIIDDEVVAQGASFKHEDIVANCVGEIRQKLKGKDCRIRASNLRTSPKNYKSYVYPDVTITCGKEESDEGNFDVLQNPTVIIEVVSRTSVLNDYRKKLMYYKQITSLQEYVLIDSFERVCVDVYRRESNNLWQNETYLNLEETLVLQSVGIEIPLADIYDNITF